MRDVTVFADEHAALELVSQGSMQSAARRVSHSKQVPLLDAERRRSHSRASTPTAKDMQTGAPSLDFQIMYANFHSCSVNPHVQIMFASFRSVRISTQADHACFSLLLFLLS